MNDMKTLLPVRLNAADIYLIPMTPADTDNIIRWRNQDFVRKNFIYQELFTPPGHAEWTKTMIESGRGVQFIIYTKDRNQPIGSTYLRDIDRTVGEAEYGIFIGEKEALGKGYGTQAAGCMLDYAFRTLGLRRIILRVLADNERARRSYEQAGFTQERYLKDEVCLEGRYRDLIFMAAFNPEKQQEDTL